MSRTPANTLPGPSKTITVEPVRVPRAPSVDPAPAPVREPEPGRTEPGRTEPGRTEPEPAREPVPSR